VLTRYLCTLPAITRTGDHFGQLIIAFVVLIKHRLRNSPTEVEDEEARGCF
jgi:hypothetical protein